MIEEKWSSAQFSQNYAKADIDFSSPVRLGLISLHFFRYFVEDCRNSTVIPLS